MPTTTISLNSEHILDFGVPNDNPFDAVYLSGAKQHLRGARVALNKLLEFEFDGKKFCLGIFDLHERDRTSPERRGLIITSFDQELVFYELQDIQVELINTGIIVGTFTNDGDGGGEREIRTVSNCQLIESTPKKARIKFDLKVENEFWSNSLLDFDWRELTPPVLKTEVVELVKYPSSYGVEKSTSGS